MAYASYGPFFSRKAAEDFSSTPYRAVKIDGNGDLVKAGSGELAVGILTDDVDGTSTDSTLGQHATYQYYGIAKWTAGASVTAGSLVMSNGSGQAIPSTTGNYALGIAQEDGASGEIISVQLQIVHVSS